MNVFFDTEFTTIDEDVPRFLISIGCVAQDGREFYAELSDTWHEAACSDFVRRRVLPLLEGGACRATESAVAGHLQRWIESLGEEEVVLLSDAPRFDWPWVEQLFALYGCWPNNLCRSCGTISFISFTYPTRQQLFDDALAEFWKAPCNAPWRHHARVDALSLACAWWHAQAAVLPEGEFRALLDHVNRLGTTERALGYAYWSTVGAKLAELRAKQISEEAR